MRVPAAIGAVRPASRGAFRRASIVAGDKASWSKGAARRLPPAGLRSIAVPNSLIPNPKSQIPRRFAGVSFRFAANDPKALRGEGDKAGDKVGDKVGDKLGDKVSDNFFFTPAEQRVIWLTKKVRLTGSGLKIREQKIPISATRNRRSAYGRSTGGRRAAKTRTPAKDGPRSSSRDRQTDARPSPPDRSARSYPAFAGMGGGRASPTRRQSRRHPLRRMSARLFQPGEGKTDRSVNELPACAAGIDNIPTGRYVARHETGRPRPAP